MEDAEVQLMQVDELLQLLDTSEAGLTQDEARRRRGRYGPNSLQQVEEESLVKKFLGQFKEPLIILLLASAFVSLLTGETADAIGIFIAVTIVNLVGFYQEYKSEKSIEALRNLTAHQSPVIRSGRHHTVDAEDLVPGDIVPLEVGARAPADIRLFSSQALQIDESILTGEAEPRHKTASPSQQEDGGSHRSVYYRNMVYMGTTCVAGRALGVVVSTGDKTKLGRLSEIIQTMEESRTPLQQKMDEIGKQLSMLAFGIVAVIFLVGMLQKKNLLDMFTIGVSLAVAAIPEGLPIVVTVTLALGVTRMAARKAIVRKLPAVEALGATTVICTDKTGTLTKNEMTAVRIYTDTVYEVSGIGYNPEGSFSCNGEVAQPQEEKHLVELLRSAMLCNNAQFDPEACSIIGQPTEGALLVAGLKAGMPDPRLSNKRLSEVPFSSGTKIMFVKCDGQQEQGWFHVKGAPEVLLQKCAYVLDNGHALPITSARKEEILGVADQFGAEALRVVAVAKGRETEKLVFLGLVGIVDPPKEGVREALMEAKAGGVHVVMLTGDSKSTAVAIAQKLGLAEDDTLSFSSQELVGTSDEQLASIVDHVSVFYRVSPEHKMQIVRAFQLRGNVVAMTGDGVNDAPALKVADIGVAMGVAGTEVAKEAADMILVDDNFATIISAIEEGKSIYCNIKNFLRFQLTTSIATLSMVAASTLFGLPLPLNPIQILWINVIMDGPPAQSLGLEPLDKELMRKRPRRRSDPIFNKQMVGSILLTAFVMVVGTLGTFYWELLVHRHADDPQTQAMTVSFTTFVMFQMFNAMNCRSEFKSVCSVGFFTNKFFVAAVAGSILMQLAAIYLPILQGLFETSGLPFTELLYSTVVASSVLFMDEFR
eukprot:CAMPEP_0114610194 /NCGR_PEP_ID=MMETSP0168-20121206/3472_1 /TAXON_ID=95228 ORGANISM="Vannella sp., Strain DIVA3 517/6/12" /NCGR_SAMPLE_ID=MMETSP0168 /ASSEMBLY_ACC=CAM_ASM_000044 /LENGTH=877 /DNA_ID=CAMNT_0001821123 /DNA_START=40 /DNA_END=2669 /DNA_ORIENTATION=+